MSLERPATPIIDVSFHHGDELYDHQPEEISQEEVKASQEELEVEASQETVEDVLDLEAQSPAISEEDEQTAEEKYEETPCEEAHNPSELCNSVTEQSRSLLQDGFKYDAKGASRNHKLVFFGNLSQLHTKVKEAAVEITHQQANMAGLYLVGGNKHEADQLVMNNPEILSIVVETTDWCGRKSKNTLLQLAARYGSFDYTDFSTYYSEGPTYNESQYFGLVERWRDYFAPEEFAKQLLAVGPLAWDAKRMLRAEIAITDFLNEISNAQSTTFAELKVELKSSIEKFQRAFATDPKQVTTTGYIFDLQILDMAVEQFNKRRECQGDWGVKADLFAICGFGYLQMRASIYDFHVISHQRDYKRLNRYSDTSLMNFVDGIPSHLACIGSTMFYGECYLANQATYMNLCLYPKFCKDKRLHCDTLYQSIQAEVDCSIQRRFN